MSFYVSFYNLTLMTKCWIFYTFLIYPKKKKTSVYYILFNKFCCFYLIVVKILTISFQMLIIGHRIK